MKKLFACFLLLCVIPAISMGENSIFVSDAAGYISIPDGFIEIESDSGGKTVYFNADGESVAIYCEKSERPLYQNAGELASLISFYISTFEDAGIETGQEYYISVTNRGECAAVKAITDFTTLIVVLNRYETVMVSVSYANPHSPNAYTPYTLEPVEQPLYVDPLEE